MIRSKLFIKNQSGFTFIEAMVAVTIFAVLMTLMLTFYIQSTTVSKKGIKEMDMLNSLGYALNVVAKDIREAKRVESGSNNGQLNLKLSDGTTVVEYRLNGNDFIRKEVGGSRQVLASNVESVNFTYYDGKGEEIVLNPQTDLTTIKRVKVTITADDGKVENSPLDVNPVELKTSAAIRAKK
ncbi:prepilin-type N-terminal cleavage/methylation domain-containing protein [Peptococcaceae bacterium]|nr:prepilin-type N-terminal cleavage/methylation domain-containing protein [Peptococcaceae bacterium]